ncbi:Valine--pyruvate aminotransferase [Thalassocella blandensis]|nr:Valine--pyruvate aminotransferase [Thalassocella blandensis]
MKYSHFGQKLGANSGIVSLMEDLGEALNVNPDLLFLGGGNPAQVPEFEALVAKHMHAIADNTERLHKLIGIYQSPRGSEEFISALVPYLNSHMGWPVTNKNVAVVNGSQSAFFILLNMFAGRKEQHGVNDALRQIIFPMMPEYLGYADQTIEQGVLRGFMPSIEQTADARFKYHIDKDGVTLDEHSVAMCVSRPTNPTGNILTLEEMDYLTALSQQHDIPLIVDCAYGHPFPGICYDDPQHYFNESNIYVLSLSKLGMPGTRTGIIIAAEDVINKLVNINTLINLANGNFGPALMTSLLQGNELAPLCDNTLLPFYRQKRDFALACVDKYFADIDYAVHEPEGAFFLWLWFKSLPISSEELYLQMKQRGVLVMDGSHFFFGVDETSSHGGVSAQHAQQCIRLTYCQSEKVIEGGIALIAEVITELLA